MNCTFAVNNELNAIKQKVSYQLVLKSDKVHENEVRTRITAATTVEFSVCVHNINE